METIEYFLLLYQGQLWGALLGTIFLLAIIVLCLYGKFHHH